jgi:GT2 family glycosyltransferase
MQMVDHPSVSAIIPTKNRAQDLEITIESLLRQTRLPDELILVDQSPETSFTKPISIPIHYMHDPGLSGLTAARNAAMKVARGDIWLFMDDDVVLEPTFLEEILAAYRPDVTGISGIITNYKRPPLGHLLWESIFMRGPFLDDRQRVYWNAAQIRDAAPIRVRQFTGALMSFKADAIRESQFDINLTGACPGEDLDFCASLPNGSILLIAPKARLVHKRSPEGRSSVHWLALHAQVSYYMRERHWRHGIRSNVYFFWLNVGYMLAASLSSLKRVSPQPWRAWRDGARKGIALALPDAGKD